MEAELIKPATPNTVFIDPLSWLLRMAQEVYVQINLPRWPDELELQAEVERMVEKMGPEEIKVARERVKAMKVYLEAVNKVLMEK